ncbi:MAG: energy transducer TonB [Sphingobacteriales bacterium]|nr:MAG: energy transducer TonB [Sphingobacteriales bacterium]
MPMQKCRWYSLCSRLIMKKYFLLPCLLALGFSASAQTKQNTTVERPPLSYTEPAGIDPPAPGEDASDPIAPPEIFMYVEQMPMFPGDSLGNYISHNTHYPKQAEKEGAEGRAIVKFIVRKDGTIDKPEVIRSTGNELLDAEALRVVKGMPKFIPGKQNGRAVNVFFQIPISFRL